MEIRRVVTGHDDQGKSVFVSDESVQPITATLMPGQELFSLWGGAETPVFPDDGLLPAQPSTWFPAVGGHRFTLAVVPPASATPPLPENVDMEAAQAEMLEKFPGVAEVMEVDAPGMHTSDTLDYVIIISGEMVLELSDGAEKVVKAGDVVVQNGARHRWHNRGDEPAIMGAFFLGAQRKS